MKALPTIEKYQTEKIREILKKAGTVENLGKLSATGKLTGNYRSVFKGNGIELDQVREYSDHDDSRLIDWNVTARFGHPYVKTFIEERDLKITFMIDISASNLFESARASKRETAAEIFAAIGLKAISENDNVALMLFTSRIEKYIPPAKGKNGFFHMLREILFFDPEHKNTDTANAINHYQRITKTPGIVILIGDFYDESFHGTLKKAAGRHQFFLLNVSDDLEERFPDSGLIEFCDPETGDMALVDTSSKKWRDALKKKKTDTNAAFMTLRSKHVHLHHVRSGDAIGRRLGIFFKSNAR